MEAKLLRSFVAVAEELHFGRAARRLHIAQPPLSVQIRKLEAELGAALFERDRRHVALTEAGRSLLPEARRLLTEHARIAREIQRVARGEAGSLSIGYTPTASYDVLPAAIPKFRAANPAVQIELVELRSAQVPEALEQGRIELGIVCAPVEPRGFMQRTLLKEPLLIALPQHHPLARRAQIAVASLRGQPFIGVDRSLEPAWADAIARALNKAGVEPEIVQQTDSKLAMLGLVASGLGLAVVSASMARLARAGVRFRPLRGLSLTLPLAVLHARAPSARARRFLSVL
jgi:DNA-binding transcriptional LysR family regulator